MALMTIDEALERVLKSATPVSAETISIIDAHGRTLARPLAAKRTQPPFRASAMDGYAVRGADVAVKGAVLSVKGEAAAGLAYQSSILPKEAVRIFTGAPVPEGADTILLQENAIRDGDRVTVDVPEKAGRHVRDVGLDFKAGEKLLHTGQRLGPRSVALAAAMDHAVVDVFRKPRIAILATGNELVMPGEDAGPDQIVASNHLAIAGMVLEAGGVPELLGIATDDFSSLEAAIDRAEAAGADVLVTIGGASVGDHDLVQSALTKRGMELGFWRIAMRPGKPLIFGRLGEMLILGLPGNPVSSIVCSKLFLMPLIRALQGDPLAGQDPTEPALLGTDIQANDKRQDYLRATLSISKVGLPHVIPYGIQDSSMLRIASEAQALLVRPPHAPAASAGDLCRIIRL
jgi:molybdopterin molybdotransferase